MHADILLLHEIILSATGERQSMERAAEERWTKVQLQSWMGGSTMHATGSFEMTAIATARPI